MKLLNLIAYLEDWYEQKGNLDVISYEVDPEDASNFCLRELEKSDIKYNYLLDKIII